MYLVKEDAMDDVNIVVAKRSDWDNRCVTVRSLDDVDKVQIYRINDTVLLWHLMKSWSHFNQKDVSTVHLMHPHSRRGEEYV